MKPYQKLYFKSFGYASSDTVYSEISGDVANDIHHIYSRGMGGTSEPDRIENLMAVTRDEHDKFGDKKKYYAYLFQMHARMMDACGVKYNKEYIRKQVQRWKE